MVSIFLTFLNFPESEWVLSLGANNHTVKAPLNPLLPILSYSMMSTREHRTSQWYGLYDNRGFHALSQAFRREYEATWEPSKLPSRGQPHVSYSCSHGWTSTRYFAPPSTTWRPFILRVTKNKLAGCVTISHCQIQVKVLRKNKQELRSAKRADASNTGERYKRIQGNLHSAIRPTSDFGGRLLACCNWPWNTGDSVSDKIASDICQVSVTRWRIELVPSSEWYCLTVLL